MFQYDTIADLFGTTVKTMFAPVLTEKSHRDGFNSMVDAKVKFDKEMFEAGKNFFDSMSKMTQTYTAK